jgi:tRNA U34 5-carboxymethylaminomethyl modifying GTPase MnmE/TrmE
MSDRLTQANAIEDVGIERSNAERVASVVVDLVKGTAATKDDLAAVKGELKADIAAVRANADLIEHRLLTRLGGLMIVVGGALFAALHCWPPH